MIAHEHKKRGHAHRLAALLLGMAIAAVTGCRATARPETPVATIPVAVISPVAAAQPALMPTPAGKLDVPIVLKIGETIAFTDAGDLRVTFETLAQDTRCPSYPNPACAEIGRARVVVAVESHGKLARFDLSTNALDYRTAAIFDGYRVDLGPVEPMRQPAGPTPSVSDYRVTLGVTRGDLPGAANRFDTPFTLRPGQSVDVSEGTRFTFERVSQDSRCPVRALCASSGTANVEVVLVQSGVTDRYTLTVGGKGEATKYPVIRSVMATMFAQQLTPYPLAEFASKEIAPADYVATFMLYNPVAQVPTPTPFGAARSR